jgi:hypothetical protein
METTSSNPKGGRPNRRTGKRVRNKREGAFFQDVPTQPVMVGKRMIDFACDKFFRSRGMVQKDSVNSRTRSNQTDPL